MTAAVGPLLSGLCDDAAIFPPGLTPLVDAVPAHVRHEASDHAELVGPLIVSAAALENIAEPLDAVDGDLALAITVGEGPAAVPAVLQKVALLPVSLRALEVAVPADLAVGDVITALDEALAGADPAPEVFVEIPRDERRPELIAALADTAYRAKFRTGGVKAELYPDEAELAEAIALSVRAGVPFKATAGLHHAVRNTDPETGFEQHGFLNVLVAVDAALQGASSEELVALLAERDGHVLADRLTALDADRVAAARRQFVSFGTCSIADPLSDLIALGLVPSTIRPLEEGSNA